MKTRLHQWPGRAVLSLCPPVLALPLLLAALPTRADTSFTATGWLIGVPLPGITVTNSSGQVYLKGNAHVARFQSGDARVTGRIEAWMDLAYQPDGTAIFCGPAYFEVGTWDASGTNFTPSGGVWALNYNGVIQADSSVQYSLAGYGIGGAIEGLRVSVTATRANSDPSTPYLASGTIKPAPVNTRMVVDDFDNNHFDTTIWTATGAGSGTLSVSEANQQLTLGGHWSTSTYYLMDHGAWVWATPGWSAPDGQTVEVRADLVSLSSTTAAAILGLYHDSGQGYGVTKAADWMCLWKEKGTILSILRMDRATTSNTNVVLVFALTSIGQNAVLTGKVLDQSGTLLHQLSVLDTPASDPALSQAEVAQLTGWRVLHDLGPESAGAPWKDGTAVMPAVCQDTDGTLPAATATFDKVELRTYEVPQVGIERAVRITFLATADVNYVLESATTPEGPWQPLNIPITDAEVPGMKQASVPLSLTAQFFRLVQAP